MGERERIGSRVLECASKETDRKSLVGRINDGLWVIGIEGGADTRGAQLVFEGWATIGTGTYYDEVRGA